jgi:hypothetical protein
MHFDSFQSTTRYNYREGEREDEIYAYNLSTLHYNDFCLSCQDLGLRVRQSGGSCTTTNTASSSRCSSLPGLKCDIYNLFKLLTKAECSNPDLYSASMVFNGRQVTLRQALLLQRSLPKNQEQR